MEKLVLNKKSNLGLYLEADGIHTEVNIKKCFPWSRPQEFWSLCDNDGKELHLVEDIDKLENANRTILLSYLSEMDFIFKITKVAKVEEEVELRIYHLETEQGFRKVFTKLEDWPEQLPNGRVMIQDLSGDLFSLHCLAELDKDSQKALAPYVDIK
jgi:hypothetical protein